MLLVYIYFEKVVMTKIACNSAIFLKENTVSNFAVEARVVNLEFDTFTILSWVVFLNVVYLIKISIVTLENTLLFFFCEVHKSVHVPLPVFDVLNFRKLTSPRWVGLAIGTLGPARTWCSDLKVRVGFGEWENGLDTNLTHFAVVLLDVSCS